MGKHIAAIVLIFFFTTCAWMILGTSIIARSNSADSGLTRGVQSNWGSAQQQSPPSATPSWIVPKTAKESTNGVTTTKVTNESVSAPLVIAQSRIGGGVDSDERKK